MNSESIRLLHRKGPGTMVFITGAWLAVIPLEARIQGVIFGSSARPAMLGEFPMTPFNPDPRPIYQTGQDPELAVVSEVPTPHGGVVDFQYDLFHLRWGAGWTAWEEAHGPPYDIYTTNWPPTGPREFIEMDLPAGTRAFYFAASHSLGSFGTFHAMPIRIFRLRRVIAWMRHIAAC